MQQKQLLSDQEENFQAYQTQTSWTIKIQNMKAQDHEQNKLKTNKDESKETIDQTE